MENTEIGLRPEQEAILLTERIKDNGRTAVNAVCNIGKDLRRMKNGGLYVHLGYETFEDYAEKEFDLKRRQAYLYISVYEKLGEDFVQSNAQLGITKLAMLTTVNAEERAEIIENNDVKAMSTKEFDELLAKYKEQGEQLSMLEDENNELKANIEELKADNEISQEVLDIKREKEEAQRRIQALEEKIKKSEEIADNYKSYSDKLLRENEQRGSMLSSQQAEIYELKKKNKQLEETEKRIQELEEMAGDFKSNADGLFAKTKKQESKINSQQEEIEQLRKKNQELETQNAEPVIKEVEVIKEVPDKKTIEAKDKEIEKLKKKVEKLGIELEEKTTSQQAEYEAKIAELKKQAEKPADDADKRSFKEQFALAYKEITGLIELIKSAEDTDKPKFISKAKQLLEAAEQALKEAEDNE